MHHIPVYDFSRSVGNQLLQLKYFSRLYRFIHDFLPPYIDFRIHGTFLGAHSNRYAYLTEYGISFGKNRVLPLRLLFFLLINLQVSFVQKQKLMLRKNFRTDIRFSVQRKDYDCILPAFHLSGYGATFFGLTVFRYGKYFSCNQLHPSSFPMPTL